MKNLCTLLVFGFTIIFVFNPQESSYLNQKLDLRYKVAML